MAADAVLLSCYVFCMTRSKSRLTLWRDTPFLGVLGDVGNFALFALRRFINDGLSQAAGALTYSTLLALVPLLVIAFAVLSGFPAFDAVKIRMEELFLSALVPEVGADVRTYLSDFTRSASNLTAVGIVALGVTAVLLLWTIEATLNQIWRVERPRPLTTRLLIFWAILTLGPLLLGASFTLTSDAISRAQNWVPGAASDEAIQLTSKSLRFAIGVLMQSAAFTLLYILVPARHVRLRDAVIGGVFAGLAFQILRWAFNSFLTSGSTYATIYGTVAIFPIFLLWIYMSWTVIIIGAVLVASFPDWWRRRDPRIGLILTPAERLEVAVALLAVLSRQAAEGGTVSQDLLTETVPLDAREDMVEALRARGYIVETEDECLALSRDLHLTRVSDLARDIGLSLGSEHDVSDRPGLSTTRKESGQLPVLLARLKDAEDDILNETLASVIAARPSQPEHSDRGSSAVPLRTAP